MSSRKAIRTRKREASPAPYAVVPYASPRPSEPSTRGASPIRRRGAHGADSLGHGSAGKPMYQLVPVDSARAADNEIPFPSSYTRATTGRAAVDWEVKGEKGRWRAVPNEDAEQLEVAFQVGAASIEVKVGKGQRGQMRSYHLQRNEHWTDEVPCCVEPDGSVYELRRRESVGSLHQRPAGFTAFSVQFVRRHNPKFDTPVGGFFSGTKAVGSFSGCEATCAEVVSNGMVWTGEKDGTLRIWNAQTGEKVFTTDQKKDIFCTSLLEVPTAGTIWAGFSDGVIRVFNARHPYEVQVSLRRHAPGSVHCLAPQVGGHCVFSGGQDNMIYMWEATTLEWMRTFSGHTRAVRCLLADSDRLYSGSDDGTIAVWDVYGRDRVEWRGHASGVHHLVKTDLHIWTGGEDGTVRVWELYSGDCVQVYQRPHEEKINSMALIGDKVWTNSGATLFLWDARNLRDEPVGQYSQSHTGYVKNILEVHRSTLIRVWTTGKEGKVQVWDTESAADWDSEDTLRGELEGRKQEVVFLKERLQRLESDVQDHSSEQEQAIGRLRAENESLTLKLTRASGDVSTLRKELEVTKAELDAANATGRRDAERLAALSRELAAFKAPRRRSEPKKDTPDDLLSALATAQKEVERLRGLCALQAIRIPEEMEKKDRPQKPETAGLGSRKALDAAYTESEQRRRELERDLINIQDDLERQKQLTISQDRKLAELTQQLRDSASLTGDDRAAAAEKRVAVLIEEFSGKERELIQIRSELHTMQVVQSTPGSYGGGRGPSAPRDGTPGGPPASTHQRDFEGSTGPGSQPRDTHPSDRFQHSQGRGGSVPGGISSPGGGEGRGFGGTPKRGTGDDGQDGTGGGEQGGQSDGRGRGRGGAGSQGRAYEQEGPSSTPGRDGRGRDDGRGGSTGRGPSREGQRVGGRDESYEGGAAGSAAGDGSGGRGPARHDRDFEGGEQTGTGGPTGTRDPAARADSYASRASNASGVGIGTPDGKPLEVGPGGELLFRGEALKGSDGAHIKWSPGERPSDSKGRKVVGVTDDGVPILISREGKPFVLLSGPGGQPLVSHDGREAIEPLGGRPQLEDGTPVICGRDGRPLSTPDGRVGTVTRSGKLEGPDGQYIRGPDGRTLLTMDEQGQAVDHRGVVDIQLSTDGTSMYGVVPPGTPVDQTLGRSRRATEERPPGCGYVGTDGTTVVGSDGKVLVGPDGHPVQVNVDGMATTASGELLSREQLLLAISGALVPAQNREGELNAREEIARLSQYSDTLQTQLALAQADAERQKGLALSQEARVSSLAQQLREQAAMSGDDRVAAAEKKLADLAEELSKRESEFAAAYEARRKELEEDFSRRRALLEEARNTEVENLRQFTEQRGQTVQAHTDRQKHLLEGIQQREENIRSAEEDMHHRPQMSDTEALHYYRYKEEQWAQIGGLNRQLHAENVALLGQARDLQEKLQSMQFIVESRPSFLKVLYDLYKMCVHCRKHLDRFGKEVSQRERPRRELLENISAVRNEVADVMNGNKWLIGNMFTEYELLHIGTSPSFFVPDAKRFSKYRPSGWGSVPATGRWSRTPTPNVPAAQLGELPTQSPNPMRQPSPRAQSPSGEYVVGGRLPSPQRQYRRQESLDRVSPATQPM